MPSILNSDGYTYMEAIGMLLQLVLFVGVIYGIARFFFGSRKERKLKVEKNDRRYRRFCDAVCADTGIENGFDFIHIMYDRENSRQEKQKKTTENLSFSDKVNGKVVLLFDDIYTRGTSFSQCAEALTRRGAVDVLGLFLGKTIG